MKHCESIHNKTKVGINYQIKKVIRFIKIYGISRTFSKVMGRLRLNHVLFRPFKFNKKEKDVAVIGCGQFAFSTIAFFLYKKIGAVILTCFDIDHDKARNFSNHYNIRKISTSIDELISEKSLQLVYIASNHYTHADYAIKALEMGLDVFIEKPICVNYDQFILLTKTIRKTNSRIFAGYNRPFSAAIIDLKNYLTGKTKNKPFSINYFISGHMIPKDHWYRNPKEGTRICGNVGHWLDLTIHILSWRRLPKDINISISYSNLSEPDDNIAITITTDLNDLISITLTSRCEPFEGINETINLQCGKVIAKINDFRYMEIWEDDRLIKKRYWPKDVGHKKSILQPYGKYSRDWHEVELSTLLMLHIKDMVLKRDSQCNFSFVNSWDSIEKQI